MIGNYLTLSPEQLERVIADPPFAEKLAYPEDDVLPDGMLDIDKAWHLIHFLLNGEVWGGEGPLANAVLGGAELEGTDAGYGPFRYLDPASVQTTSMALAQVSASDLWERFDAKRVASAEIYPVGWAGDQGDRDYVLSNFKSLQQYFAAAAASGKALLLYLS